MKEKEIFEKNLTLSTEFSRYLLEHPEFAEQLPNKAHIVLLPKYDAELYAINLNGAEAHRQQGDKRPLVFVEVEKLAPLRSRLIGPRVLQSEQPSFPIHESKATYHQEYQGKAERSDRSKDTKLEETETPNDPHPGH